MRAKRSALSQQVTTRHVQTDVHESITKQDRNNINDPQKKHHLGTNSKKFFTGGLKLNTLTPSRKCSWKYLLLKWALKNISELVGKCLDQEQTVSCGGAL